MNVSSTQLTTRLRTWALVAGLTGGLVALGALIGGSWLWLFVALAAGLQLGGYLFSDRLALRAAHAEPLDATVAPEVHAIARDLADRARIPVPRLFVMPGEQANAFATGRDPGHAAVAMTIGLLRDLPADEVRGVLAHEFAHIANRDILVSSVAAMIAGAISALVNVLQLSFLFGGEEDGPLSSLGALAAMILAPIGAMLIQLGVSRQREYLADATAARMLGSGAPLADALETISAARPRPLAVNPATAPMYIVNPLSGERATRLFSTHPPVADRIRRLRAYAPRTVRAAAPPAAPRRRAQAMR